MNEEETARAVARGLHQYEKERRAAEARWERQFNRKLMGGILLGFVIFSLATLWSFGKLG
ncbi:hypothetical protein [Streptomyces sp. TE5632]